VIAPPRRSVTRFFVPMIDVLTLLFCIFLLMPYVKPEAPAGPAGADDAMAAARRELEQLRARLAGEREQAVRQQAVCVLEIDAATGRLFERTHQRPEVADQAAALALIDRERRPAAGREVYFLILYPRELTGFPEQRQVAAYERWFAGVPHGFDNPRGRRTRERQP
jgi:hypothetical protein